MGLLILSKIQKLINILLNLKFKNNIKYANLNYIIK